MIDEAKATGGTPPQTLGNWLFHVFREADGSLALEEALHVIMDSIKDYFPCQSMALVLIDEDTSEMRIKTSRQISYSFVKKFKKSGPGPAVFEVVLEQQPLHIEVAERDSDIYKEVKLEHDFDSAVLVPIIKQQRGVGYVFTDRSGDSPFTTADVVHLQVLGYLIGNLIDKFEILKATKHLSRIDDASKALKYDAFVPAFLTETQRALSYNYSLTLALLDVDAFRKYLETYGIDRAHALLADITGIVKEHVRDMDILARFGADELVLCLSGLSATEAEQLLHTVQEQIEQRLVTEAAASIGLTVGALLIESERDLKRPLQEILAALGRNLVEAKKGDHNRFYIGPP